MGEGFVCHERTSHDPPGPTHYLQGKIPWEDVVRPASEPLSTLPPTAWGWSVAELERHLGTPVMPPGTSRG